MSVNNRKHLLVFSLPLSIILMGMTSPKDDYEEIEMSSSLPDQYNDVGICGY